MAYIRSNIVVRPAYAGLSGIWDSITDFAKNTVNAFGEAKKAQGAAQAQAAQVALPAAPSSGISTGTVVAIGAVGVAALLILNKRKRK